MDLVLEHVRYSLSVMGCHFGCEGLFLRGLWFRFRLLRRYALPFGLLRLVEIIVLSGDAMVRVVLLHGPWD